MDEGITGNFEITLFKDASCSDEGNMVHSKQAGGGFPDKDWSTFDAMITSDMWAIQSTNTSKLIEKQIFYRPNDFLTLNLKLGVKGLH